MSETLTETFARFAEDAEFRHWNERRTAEYRFVYAHQDESLWRFTLEEWWRIATRAIRNNGTYSLPLSKQVQGRSRKNAFVEDGGAIRSVNLVRWTVADWKNELDALAARRS